MSFQRRHPVGKVFRPQSILFLALLVVLMGLSVSASAEVQIPAEVEAQAQSLEERFVSVLAEECSSQVCAPVGCEILNFRTLDQKQNSSLPGLDMGEDAVEELHYKLGSVRCEFAYESTLTPEAVTSLRQRVGAKVRQGGVSLAILGRKLNPSSPALKTLANTGAEKGPQAPAPQSALGKLWEAVSPALPNALLLVLGTMGLLALIWGVRRLGKSAPVAAAAVVDEAKGEEGMAESSAEPIAVSDGPAANGPDAGAVAAKRKELMSRLEVGSGYAEVPGLAEIALQPVVAKGDVEELCRVLAYFGPQPLLAYSQRAEHKELFAEVRKRYEGEQAADTEAQAMDFLSRMERRVALAQLGHPDLSLQEELSFLREVAPDEFAQLVHGLNHDELMAVLSFVPASFRAHYLEKCPEPQVEAYVQHVLSHPRLPDQLVRKVARSLREQYSYRHAEIKSVSREQLPLLEQLLNTLSGAKRERLVRRLRVEQPAIFEQLISGMLLDRALVHVPDNVLNDLFLLLSPEEAAAYLDIHPDRKEIFGKLKGTLARSIQTHSRADSQKAPIGLSLDFVESSSPEVERARVKIAQAMKEKSKAGVVNLRRLNETVVSAV